MIFRPLPGPIHERNVLNSVRYAEKDDGLLDGADESCIFVVTTVCSFAAARAILHCKITLRRTGRKTTTAATVVYRVFSIFLYNT